MSEPQWPSYDLGPTNHLHALGVIAAAYNQLEHRLLGIFLISVGYRDSTAWLFRRLNDNRARIDLILLSIEEKSDSVEVKDSVEHFCKCMDNCSINRNILMHSRTVIVTSGDEFFSLDFVKVAKSKDWSWNRYTLDIGGLREIADEIYEVAEYGRKLHNHVLTTYRAKEFIGPSSLPPLEPLPSKPPIPTVLTAL